MDINLVHIWRSGPAKGASALRGPEVARNAVESQSAAPPKSTLTRYGKPGTAGPVVSGLETPFNPRQTEAAVLRSQLETAQSADPGALSPEEQAVVDQLSARDREVRNHEEAHARVGGQYAGSPSYTFQQGPDGKSYAIGGEVPIDISPVPDDPAATIVKMEIVKAAALAPAEPSGQDRRVAATADAQRQQAVADLAALRRQTEPVDQPSLNIAA